MKWIAQLTGLIVITLAFAPGSVPREKIAQTTSQEVGRSIEKPEYSEWRFPVAIPASASAEQKAAASRLAEMLGFTSTVQVGDNRNPVCCFWIELTNWWPNPGGGGYVIIIQHGGAIMYASTIEDAKRGIERIESVRQKRGERFALPIGVLSSYPVWPANAATPKAGDAPIADHAE